jgi:hypothetical protein
VPGTWWATLRTVVADSLPLLIALGLFLACASYQLSLPGLHYDEAKEAGLNAAQLLTGQPITAFRDAAMQIGPWRLPLMVQDYIGALNVLLALPFLAIGGINVAALRSLPLLIAALTLLTTWRVAWRLGGRGAAMASALLLAVNPSFIFWSRQGIFVTNLTALIFMLSLLTGLRWWAGRRPADLWLTAFLWGLGIYVKLLFVWAIGALVIVAAAAWAWARWRKTAHTERHEARGANPGAPHTMLRAGLPWLIAALCFVIPLIPLVIFNLHTGGTAASIFGNLGHSYYGVDNRAYLPNLLTRLGQVRTLLRGDHFWYLGGVYANGWAPWLAAALTAGVSAAWISRWIGARGLLLPGCPAFLLPIGLLALIVAQSAFTVSDLFITHYALLAPLLPLAGGLAAGWWWGGGTADEKLTQRRQDAEAARRTQRSLAPFAPLREASRAIFRTDAHAGRGATADENPVSAQCLRHTSQVGHRIYRTGLLALALILLWAGGDLWTTLRYHRGLTASGGLASHSDAINRLAAYLERGGLSAPLALDWGMDAQVRFLTVGRVNPIEVFGYGALDAADPGFAGRVRPFLDNPAYVYLAHAPEATVFRGRMEALAALAREQGAELREEIRFTERGGRPLFVVYRAARPR